LLHRRAWLAAISLMCLSFVFSAVALGTGQLAAVQLLIILELPMTLIIGARILHGRITAQEWAGAAAMTAGVIGLLVLLDPRPGPGRSVGPTQWIPSVAAAPDGTVYVAFEDNKSSSSGAIGVARSRDGGRTWTSAPLPGVSAFAFEPSIAVDSRATVGVTWYDLRNDRPGDAAPTADVQFAYSGDGGASWRQTRVAGPTDLRTAPLPAHIYVGEN
jgi:hypothetical protein